MSERILNKVSGWQYLRASSIFKNVSNKRHDGSLEVLSATQDKGIIPRSQVEIDIKYDPKSLTNYKKVEKANFVISLRSFQGGIEYSEYEGIVSPAYTVLSAIMPISHGYYRQFFKSTLYIKRLRVAVYGIRDGKQIGYADFGSLKIPYPPLEEQRRIAEILTAQDKIIALKERRLAEKRRQKTFLAQRLLTGKTRLPGFDGEGKTFAFTDVLTVLASQKYQIPKLQYLPTGKFPVIDQGKKKIAGYSNNVEKVMKCPEGGIIVFGDHTREIKYIDFDFIVGADGTQLLLGNFNITSTIYLFYYLSIQNIPNNGYSRHLKYVKSLVFRLPSLEEQQAIAEVLTCADREIEALQRDLELEKRKKKALMQLLLTGVVRVNSRRRSA